MTSLGRTGIAYIQFFQGETDCSDQTAHVLVSLKIYSIHTCSRTGSITIWLTLGNLLTVNEVTLQKALSQSHHLDMSEILLKRR